MVLDGEDEDDALIGALRADLPLLFEIRSPAFDVLAVEGVHGNYYDGGVGLSVYVGGQGFDGLLRCGVKDTGEVRDVCGWLGKIGRGLGIREAGRKQGRDDKQGGREAAQDVHRMILRSGETVGSLPAED